MDKWIIKEDINYGTRNQGKGRRFYKKSLKDGDGFTGD
jgi:hypothetical protein